ALGARAEAVTREIDAFDDPRPRPRRDRARDSFVARIRFGGAVCVAIPHASHRVAPETVVARLRDLARLRAELRETARA
ncbi:MAG TPA: hypothetical protein VKE69_07540, partial [Planctomycetota bacterium]|nr:hypothetical protein [Planctomycetota bacterium]